MDQSTEAASTEISPRELAAVGTALALDRTLLAIVRTALTLIGFGFTLARVVHDMVKKGFLPGFPTATPQQMGIILIILGVLTLVGGAYEHMRLGKLLQVHGKTRSMYSVSLMVTLIVALLGVLLTLSLLLEFTAH